MTIRRRFASVPPVMLMTSKSSRTRSYDAMPSRASHHYLLGYPTSKADQMIYDTRAEDYMNDRVTSAGIFSSYAVEEGYDTAKKSRDRDARLLRDATDAIVGSESFASPQLSVAARRVARGYSMPPRAVSLPPRPLYPAQVGFWDAPGSYEAMYGAKTAGTTTTSDYYPYLQYLRRPLIVYQKPSYSPVMERARSVPPPLFYQEEPRRKIAPVPLYDVFRERVRASSVPRDIMADSPSWYSPYYSYYGHSMSPYYRSRLALYDAPRTVPLWSLPTEGLRAHRAPNRYLSRAASRANIWGLFDEPFLRRSRREDEIEDLKFGFRPRVLGSPLARATLARAWRHSAYPFAPPRMSYVNESKYGFPLLFVPRKGEVLSSRRKAAIIASKMDADPFKGRRPRSEYAARKYRAMRRSDQEGVYLRSPMTSAYYASNPPLPRMTERKAIRTDEGYTKPKNLLSWQYRLDSIMKPKDLLNQPSSFGRIRQQVRAAQEGMDRHRQMLDRYLPEEGADSSDAAARVLRKMAEMDKRDYTSGGGKGDETAARSHEAPY